MSIKNDEKLFKIGNIINITTKYYAKMSNQYLDEINSSSKRYNNEQVKNDILNGKKWRPVVILWSNKNSNKIICSSLTTQVPTKRMIKFKYNNNQYWNYNVIIIDKKDVSKIRRQIFDTNSQETINIFLNSWPKIYLSSYSYLMDKISSFEKN